LASRPDADALEALSARLAEEDDAYAAVLDALDRLAAGAPDTSSADAQREATVLNELWSPAAAPAAGGLGGALRRRAWDAVAPALARQAEFNASLVRLLNAELPRLERTAARLSELSGALVRYAQRVQPMVDARDRVQSAAAVAAGELVLDAFGRELESQGRRLAGLLALRDRVDALAGELRGLRGALAEGGGPSAGSGTARVETGAASPERAARREPVAPERIAWRAERIAGLAPATELAADDDPLASLRAQADGSQGAILAPCAVATLPPALLQALLAEAHRTLRPGGVLLLESADPRSLSGLVEAGRRGLGGAAPPHPDALRFAAAAAGFSEVVVEPLSPLPAGARLLPVPAGGLPEAAAAAINGNIERLNALLCGPLEYALVARR
jgi:hypothetical protein